MKLGVSEISSLIQPRRGWTKSEKNSNCIIPLSVQPLQVCRGWCFSI